MKDFITGLKEGLRAGIDAIPRDGKNTLQVLTSKIIVTTEAIARLKAFIIGYSFKNKQEEIEFFKHEKPSLYSELLCYKRLLELEINAPVSKTERHLFYEKELHSAGNTLDLDRYWVTYYRTGATYLDDKYFLRNAASDDPAAAGDILTSDTRFCTIGSIKFSQILAFEMLIREIERRKAGLLDNQPEAEKTSLLPPRLKWKGPKVGLVEFARACKEVGALDEPLQVIFECFEWAFSTQIENHSRKFQEIIARKKEDAIYLNKLKQGLINLADRMNSNYKPKK